MWNVTTDNILAPGNRRLSAPEEVPDDAGARISSLDLGPKTPNSSGGRSKRALISLESALAI
jgi:hypothetical protein